jgi:hypothetical protein
MVALLAGCSSADSDYPLTGILLTEEPDGVQTVLEVRKALLGSEGSGSETVAHQHPDHAHSAETHADHEHAGQDHTVHAEHEEHAGHDDDDVNHAGDADHDQEDHELPHQHASHDAEHDDTSTHSHESAEPVGPAGPMEVVVVGQIGGLTNPWQQTEPDFPFVEGKATFFLADSGAVAEHQAGGHQHASGEDCAFCASHAKDSSALLAVVQFKDKQGTVLRRDVRRWFTLQGNETVVVRGQARIVAGGLLVIDADSLYVRR